MNSINTSCSLSGNISGTSELSGSLSAEGSLNGSISIAKEYDDYAGSYSVIPDTHNEQVLKTENKLLKKDIVVDKVPYWETSNDSGGKTAYVGERIEIYGN